MTLRCRQSTASKAGGLPLREPQRLRCPPWSAGSGMTAVMPRSRRWARIAREAQALPPRSRSGRVRGRPHRAGHSQLGQQRQRRRGIASLARRDRDNQQ